MRKLFGIAVLATIATASSCIKEEVKYFNGSTVVEIDASVLNANAGGVTYPVINRIPLPGRAVVNSATGDLTLRRWNGKVQFRVNLVGPQMPTEQTIGFKVFGTPITSIAYPITKTGQTPTQPAATLTVRDAVAGVHYSTLNGICTIPANSSFGYIDVNILNPGATAGQARFLGIRLDSTGTLRPNPNYGSLGFTIDQR